MLGDEYRSGKVKRSDIDRKIADKKKNRTSSKTKENEYSER